MRGLRPPFADVLATLADPIDAAFARELTEGMVAREVPEAVMAMLCEENLKVPARVWSDAFEGLAAADPPLESGRISVPTLIVWARQAEPKHSAPAARRAAGARCPSTSMLSTPVVNRPVSSSVPAKEYPKTLPSAAQSTMVAIHQTSVAVQGEDRCAWKYTPAAASAARMPTASEEASFVAIRPATKQKRAGDHGGGGEGQQPGGGHLAGDAPARLRGALADTGAHHAA